jgi:hypothetical protein
LLSPLLFLNQLQLSPSSPNNCYSFLYSLA